MGSGPRMMEQLPVEVGSGPRMMEQLPVEVGSGPRMMEQLGRDGSCPQDDGTVR